MDNIVFLTIFATLVFVGLRLAHMHFVTKEMQPLKTLINECVYVAASVAITTFGYFHLEPYLKDYLAIVNDVAYIPEKYEVFTDEPQF